MFMLSFYYTINIRTLLGYSKRLCISL